MNGGEFGTAETGDPPCRCRCATLARGSITRTRLVDPAQSALEFRGECHRKDVPKRGAESLAQKIVSRV